VLAATAAALSTIGGMAAGAQSFYETITSVARTDVGKSASRSNAAKRVARRGSEKKVRLDDGRPPVPDRAPKSEIKRAANSGLKKDTRTGKNVDEIATTWPRTEVLIAQARCKFLLSHIEAEVVHEAPMRKGPCGNPAPVKLISLGSKPRVAVNPPALLKCDMVKSLHDWLVKDLQPLARKHLKSPIVKIETMSSYSCRNAYGRSETRLSQHARANAIDIRGFVTAKNARTRLVSHWGPTARDLRRAARSAAARAKKKQEKLTAKASEAAATTAKSKKKTATGSLAGNAAGLTGAIRGSGVTIRPSLLESSSAHTMRGSSTPRDANRPGFGLAPSRLGGPALSAVDAKDLREAPSWPVYLVSDNISAARAETPKAQFLRGAHKTACKLFGTVLGPEANNTHRNHFHLDLAQRRLGHYCR
jgi:hypothetical protein